jgi:uncharacterized protein
MENKLAQKYALVTGASSGIGWHLSRELAQRGYSIIAASNQPEQLAALKYELEKVFPIAVFTITINLAQTDAAQKLFDICESNNLEVDVLVNNAGILIIGEAMKVEHSRAAEILQLHMVTPALLCNLFGKKMTERKRGFILNVSSISAVMPYPTISLYGPTKTFVRSFTRAIRTEMKSDNIHVTCLLPGATATALYDSHNVNIPLAMKLGVMKKPESVARSGVNALFANRPEMIPGIINKILVAILPVIPNSLIAVIYKSRKG